MSRATQSPLPTSLAFRLQWAGTSGKIWLLVGMRCRARALQPYLRTAEALTLRQIRAKIGSVTHPASLGLWTP